MNIGDSIKSKLRYHGSSKGNAGPFRIKAGQYVVFDGKDEHGRDAPWMGQESTKEIKVNHQAGYNPNQMKVTKSAL